MEVWGELSLTMNFSYLQNIHGCTHIVRMSSFSFSNIRTNQSLPKLCHPMNRLCCGPVQTKNWRKKSLVWHEISTEKSWPTFVSWEHRLLLSVVCQRRNTQQVHWSYCLQQPHSHTAGGKLVRSAIWRLAQWLSSVTAFVPVAYCATLMLSVVIFGLLFQASCLVFVVLWCVSACCSSDCDIWQRS